MYVLQFLMKQNAFWCDQNLIIQKSVETFFIYVPAIAALCFFYLFYYITEVLWESDMTTLWEVQMDHLIWWYIQWNHCH